MTGLTQADARLAATVIEHFVLGERRQWRICVEHPLHVTEVVAKLHDVAGDVQTLAPEEMAVLEEAAVGYLRERAGTRLSEQQSRDYLVLIQAIVRLRDMQARRPRMEVAS